MEQPPFDFGEESPSGGVIPSPPEPLVSRWLEVPQALFLLWSPAMQMAYCAARDRDSAATARERSEDPAWYEARAEGYERA